MTLNLRLVYYAIGLLAILFASAARSNDLLDAAQPWDGPVPLARYFDVLEDPQGTLTLADVRKADIAARFKPSTTNYLMPYGVC